MSETILKHYAVKNAEGKYFKTKSNWVTGWVNDINKAKIFLTIGPARNLITYCSNTWPHKEPPSLVILHVTKLEVIDETLRLAEKELKEHKAFIQRRKNNKAPITSKDEDLLEELTAKVNLLKGAL